MPALVRALNRVDLPTLGKPTMPHFKLMEFSLELNPFAPCKAARAQAAARQCAKRRDVYAINHDLNARQDFS